MSPSTTSRTTTTETTTVSTTDPTTETARTTAGDSPTHRPVTRDSALAGFDVQPAVLRRAAGTFHAEAEILVEAATRLDSHLQTLGPCWGTDRVGARFGATYQPASEKVRANLGALTVGLLRIASALRAVADSYEVVDEDAGRRSNAQSAGYAGHIAVADRAGDRAGRADDRQWGSVR